jgi:hypothetical protein
MTIITPTGITGITSITSTGNTLQFQNPSGADVSVSGLNVTSGTNINVSGIITASGGFSGNINSSGVSTFSGGVVVAAGSAGAPSISPTGDNNTGIFFPAPDTVAIGEGGVEALRINSSGNLGIGTNNPQYPLDVFSTPTNDPYAIIRTVSSTVGGFLAQGTTQAHLRFVTGGNWDDVSAKKWQIRVGAGAGLDDFRVYSWTKTADVLLINNSGHLQTPYQPAVEVSRTSNFNVTSDSTAGTVVPFDSEILDRNNNFSTSTYRFTAPVAGYYLFWWSYGANVNSNTVYRTYLWVNNSISIYTQLRNDNTKTGTAYTWGSRTAILSLNANDFVELRASSDNGTAFLADANLRVSMGISLLG